MFGWGSGPDLDTAPKRLAVADYFSVIGLDVHYPPEVCEPAKHGLAALSKARRHFVADCIIVNVKETVPTDYEACEPVCTTRSASLRQLSLPRTRAHAHAYAHTMRSPTAHPLLGTQAIHGNLVCLRRCGASPRDDYIIDILVVERKNISGLEVVNGLAGTYVFAAWFFAREYLGPITSASRYHRRH